MDSDAENRYDFDDYSIYPKTILAQSCFQEPKLAHRFIFLGTAVPFLGKAF